MDAPAAAAPTVEVMAAPTKIELLPDGRPKAQRREKRSRTSNSQPTTAAPSATTAGPSSVVVAAKREAWLAWHRAHDTAWRQQADERVGAGISMMRLPKAVFEEIEGILPVIYRVADVPDGDAAIALYGKYGKKKRGKNKGGTQQEEFAVAPIFAPPLIQQLAPMGIFPMTIPIYSNLPRFPAFKLHAERAVSFVGHRELEAHRLLAAPLENPVKPMNGVSRIAKRYAAVVDSHWDDVCDMIQQQHGPDWLSMELRAAFTHMFLHPERYPKMRLHCIAIVEVAAAETDTPQHREIPTPDSFSFRKDANTPKTIRIQASQGSSGPYGRVVAGELGFVCGSLYTSLTGAFVDDGTGTLQLAVLQALLHLGGFVAWDLGMTMSYKEKQVGVEQVPRKRWVELATTLAGRAPEPVAAEVATGLAPAPEGGAALAKFASVPVMCCDVIEAFRGSLARGSGGNDKAA